MKSLSSIDPLLEFSSNILVRKREQRIHETRFEVSGVGCQRTENREQRTEDRGQKTEEFNPINSINPINLINSINFLLFLYPPTKNLKGELKGLLEIVLFLID
jgi:hypothetical protein